MKKVLALSLMLGASIVALPTVEAKAATASTPAAGPQIMVRTGPQRNRRWNNRRVRTVTTTRVTRVGFRTFRETIRTTYLPNGRTRTQVIRRVRIR